MRPRLFLDVDGVINADPIWNNRADQTEGLEPWSWHRLDAGGFRVVWSPQVTTFLAEMAERVDMFWLTTWEEMAGQVLAGPMGLPDFPVAPGERHGGHHMGDHWWKWLTVKEMWEAEPRPFIWLDDDIKDDAPAIDWLCDLPEGEWLAISPNSYHGLTREHLSLISEFVERHTATADR